MRTAAGILIGAAILAIGWRAAAGEAERLLAPPPGEGPVVVLASFALRDVADIDDSAETFQFSGVLRLTWRDPRQAFDPAEAGVAEKLYQGDFQFNEIAPSWYPQVVLANESGLYESHGVLLRVRPDGTQTLLQSINAIAESDLELRRMPFDAQTLRADFEALGMHAGEIRFEVESDGAEFDESEIHIPQWDLHRALLSARPRPAPEFGPGRTVSQFVVELEVRRQSLFLLRLVVLPLSMIVMLSWSVFWMDRSSLGDRVNVSFVGILTAVAYQLVVSELMPHVSDMTIMHAFLNLSFFTMSATVVVNLIVGACDKAGRADLGDRVDLRCRWLFPLAYAAGLIFSGMASHLLS